jgi:hypothetical protein
MSRRPSLGHLSAAYMARYQFYKNSRGTRCVFSPR